MGMDVSGRNPKNKTGEYFRASVWSWRPIHEIMATTCRDLLGDELLQSMSYNDGAGPEDQETCTKMADRISVWMEHNAGGAEIDVEWGRVEAGTGRILNKEELEKNPHIKTEALYHVDDEHLNRWVEFLRNCGGFEVW